MDHCCSTLKTSTHLVKLSGGNYEGFLRGEKIIGSLNGTVSVNYVRKKASKIAKPGVAFSVITSDNDKQTMLEVNILL